MLCSDVEFCILQLYHPETKTSNFFIVKRNITLTTIRKQIMDCILVNNHVLDWAHTEFSELHGFAKEILGKIPKFELLRPFRTYIKNCNTKYKFSTKLIPQIKFVNEFDLMNLKSFTFLTISSFSAWNLYYFPVPNKRPSPAS